MNLLRMRQCMGVLAALQGGCDAVVDHGMPCPTECESQGWPAIVVGTDIPREVSVTVAVDAAQYRVLEYADCSELPAIVSCSRSFRLVGAQRDSKSVVLTVGVRGRQLTRAVDVRADVCGHDIAYLRLLEVGAGEYLLEEPRFLSPCGTPEL
jgi:hypothetical protein